MSLVLIDDQIEDVSASQLEVLVSAQDYVAVFFCEYLFPISLFLFSFCNVAIFFAILYYKGLNKKSVKFDSSD